MNISIKNISKAFIPPSVLFAFHIFAIVVFNVYVVIQNFDMLMHFFGGASIGITAVLVYKELVRVNIINKLPVWLLVFLSVSVVALVASSWEFAEYLADTYLGTYMQAGLPDTMGDMALGIVGGLVSSFLISMRDRR
ncbi:MAG: hypothetical protein COU35_03675 [Candidatus Magasanikbacteria bacterium CG10_big_fil_rev_8_21_14_0_10_47_10]|uniref:VanZ-like domain-containing protein n=1 Tax=Candidatus Magasanikbacteria bacterium CG10_big_fil_rev_8_21_14_0_10_47_10 TaxID=1974652 RepID=A0A2H0TPY0_9BACT|nr:MAG: hypothetical protein COU35_03675 [Candidatus Magasanikbacteria bacterium CG10_big_fil_rev_8_21_14_0_10_47_10]